MSAPQIQRKDPGSTPQIKICGITSPEDAISCALLGADAVGLVFYPKSPRYIDIRTAEDICSALPPETARVGVFVDAEYEMIMERVEACGLTAVQLHGNESPGRAGQLAFAGIKVIKALYINKCPAIDSASAYPDAAFLVEAAGGRLPGGNAVSWDWGDAFAFGKTYQMILAGGLSPDNVADAICKAGPDAVDVSSGVEAFPGRKDRLKIKKFIHAVRACTPTRPPRRIFP